MGVGKYGKFNMQGQYWLIKKTEDVSRVLDNIREWAASWDYSAPLAIQPRKYTNPRSLSQNALLHKWFGEIADHFESKGVDINADKAKSLMKLKFLGTEDIVIRNTTIPNQLKSTSKLDKGEMMRFMDQVSDWASDHGVVLSMPADSEYMRLRGEHG